MLHAVRAIRPDTVVWLLVAGVLFAGSATLTSLITHVEGQHGAFVLTFVGSKLSRQPTVAFESQGRDLLLTVDDIDDNLQTVAFGPVRGELAAAVRCTEVDEPTTMAYQSITVDGSLDPASIDEIYYGPSDDNSKAGGLVSYHIELAQLRRRYPYVSNIANTFKYGRHDHPARKIACKFPSIVTHDTFVSRSFEVVVEKGYTFPERPLSLVPMPICCEMLPRYVSLNDNDARDLRVANLDSGEMLLGSRMAVPDATLPNGELTVHRTLKFTWDSISEAELRDIFIV
jgi:hypothetical protein